MTTERESGAEEFENFDHHSDTYSENWPRLYTFYRQRSPVFSTAAHGGYWVLTRYNDICAVAGDDYTFSSRNDLGNEQGFYRGVSIPPSPVKSIPLEVDPPELYHYRRILSPSFSNSATLKLGSYIRHLSQAFVRRLRERQWIDIVADYANPIPAMVTMKLIGLPISDWKFYSEIVNGFLTLPRNSAALAEMDDAIASAVRERKLRPRDDLITALVTAETANGKLSPEEIVSMCSIIIAGGVDTTKALFSCAAHWLSSHPAERSALAQNPELGRLAVEEFLRFFTPVQTDARTVVNKCYIDGVRLNPGDRLMLPWAAANRDPTIFASPDVLRLHRHPNRHLAFGVGAHYCLGARIARLEFQIMLEELLRHAPNFHVEQSLVRRYGSTGEINGFSSLPALLKQ